MAATGKAEIRALMLRLPKGLHRQLAQRAKKADRSLNTEIVWRLGLSLSLESELSKTRYEALRDAVDVVLHHASELQKLGPVGIGAKLGFGGLPGIKGLLGPGEEDEI
jgi:hypothetical protein